MMSRTNNRTNAVCTVIPNCYSSMVTSGPYGVQYDSREHSLMHFIRREQGLNEKCRSGDALPHFFHSCSTLFQPFPPCGVFIKLLNSTLLCFPVNRLFPFFSSRLSLFRSHIFSIFMKLVV